MVTSFEDRMLRRSLLFSRFSLTSDVSVCSRFISISVDFVLDTLYSYPEWSTDDVIFLARTLCNPASFSQSP